MNDSSNLVAHLEKRPAQASESRDGTKTPASFDDDTKGTGTSSLSSQHDIVVGVGAVAASASVATAAAVGSRPSTTGGSGGISATLRAEILARDFGVEASMRIDVFRAKQAAEENIKKSGKKLTAEEQRLVEKMLLDGKRAGLALPDAEREELTKLKKELSQTCLEFSVSIYRRVPAFLSRC